MSNEKMKILEMIESKVISPEEGLKLLNAMDQIDKSTILSKEAKNDVSDQINDSLEEAMQEKNDALEELDDELEEMADEIEEEVDEIIEELEDSYDDLVNDDIDSEAEEILRAKVEDIKGKAEELKKKIKIDLDLNGKKFKKTFFTEDFMKDFGKDFGNDFKNEFKNEFRNFKRSFKGEMKSLNKESKRFAEDMSKLGKETSNLSKEIVDDVMGAINEIKFDVNNKDFQESEFTYEPGSSERNYDLAQEFSIDCDGKTEVSINVIMSDIIFITEEREDMLVNYINYSEKDSEMFKILVEENSKKVTLTEKSTVQKVFNFDFGNNRREVLIRMPRKYKESLSIKTVSGDLDMNYLDSDSFRFSSVSGDMKADIIYSVNSLVKTTSGDCKIDLFRGNMMFTSVSGDVKLKYETLDGDFTMKSVSGDASLILPKNSEFEVLSRSISGDVNCDFPLTIIGTQKRGRLRGQVGSDAHTVTASTTSGDLGIKRY